MSLIKSSKYQKVSAILCGSLILLLKNRIETQEFLPTKYLKRKEALKKHWSLFCRQSGEGMKVCRVKKATLWRNPASWVFQKNNSCLCTALSVNNLLLELQCLHSTTCPFLHRFYFISCPFLHHFYFISNDPGVITSQEINEAIHNHGHFCGFFFMNRMLS